MPTLEIIEQAQMLMSDEDDVETRLALLMSPSQTESEDTPSQGQSDHSPCQDDGDHYPSPKESECLLSQEETADYQNLAENENSTNFERVTSPVHSETGRDGSSSRRRKNTTDNDRREKKRHKSGKKERKKKHKSSRKKNRVTRRDPLFDHDPNMLQGPTGQDFSNSNYNSLCTSQYRPYLDPEPQAIDDEEDEFVAPPPGIPDASDDRREDRPPPEQAPEPPTPEPETREAPARRRRRRKPPRAPEPLLPGFLRLPLEIRDKIYREILVVEVPILVRDGWRRIYARKRPGIEIDLLCTSRQLYHEATRILYGENRFLYRLRDPPRRFNVVDVEELSLNDSKDDEEVLLDNFRNNDVEGRNDKIDIGKFGSYFRRLIVEAERNRYSEETKEAMAEAIRIFTTQPGGSTKACAGGIKMNIHTFTIRVSPQYQPDNTFTFVDFFEKHSPVMKAISSLSCQFFKIDLLTTYLNGGQQPTISRFTVHTRYLQFSRFAARQRTGGGRGLWRADPWSGDRLMDEQRKYRKQKSQAGLDKLDGHALDACRKHVLDDVIQMSQDELDDEEYDPIVDSEPADGDYEEMVLGTGG